MSKTINKPTAKDLKKEQELKDVKRAEELISTYASLMKDLEESKREYMEAVKPYVDDYNQKTKEIQSKYEEMDESIRASLKAAEEELIRIGDRNKNRFGIDGNWYFEEPYYLHLKGKTEVIMSPDFSMAKFMRKFGDYVDFSFKIKDLMKKFTDADERPKFQKLGIDLKQETSIEIKMKSEKKAKK